MPAVTSGSDGAAAGGTAETSSKESLGSRAEFMPLGDGERPRPTHWVRAVAECTIGFLLVVHAVVRQLWKDREDDIIRACAAHMPTGCIDEMDVLALVVSSSPTLSGSHCFMAQTRTSLASGSR